MTMKTFQTTIVALLAAIFMSPVLPLSFGESDCTFVTIPQEVDYPVGWRSGPGLRTSSDIIFPGGSVSAWIVASGLSCPPYSWSVSGTGYSISPAQTFEDGETVAVTSAEGA